MIRLYIALGVFAALVAAFIGAGAWLDHEESVAYHRGYDKAVDEAKDRENTALKQALDDKAKLEVELQGISHEAAVARDAAAVAGDRAVVAGDRLRIAESALRRASQCPAAPAAGGASADASGDLLADVQRRLDAATERIGRFADASRIAGLACERAYEALK